MSDVLVLLFVAAAVVLALVLTRRRPGAPATAAVKPTEATGETAPAAVESAAEPPPIHDEATHQREVEGLRLTAQPGPVLAGALFRLSIAMARAGEMRRAVVPLREAVGMPTTDLPSERERLTYVTNLGEMLARSGELDEAERVLRESLPAREAAFGRLHPAYAFGLAPLARTMLAKGDAVSAAAAADEVVAILAATHHENVPLALGLAACARVVAGQPPPPDERIQTAQLSGFLAGLLDACDVVHLEAGGRVLTYAVELLGARGLLATPAGVRVLDRLGQSARARRAFGEAVAAWEKLAEVTFAADQPEYGVAAKLGVAVARAEGGDPAGAAAVYEQLAERMKDGRAELRSRIHREHGLFLSERDQAAALVRLTEAVAFARAGEDGETLGMALAASGVWEHHARHFELAEPLLDEAQRVLPDKHPDGLAARNHLAAARQRGACDCGHDQRREIEAALNRAVTASLSAELVRVRVEQGARGMSYGLEFARQPTPEELESARTTLERTLKTLAAESRSTRAPPAPEA